MQKILVVSVIVAVVAGGLGFGGGMLYSQSPKNPGFGGLAQNGQRQFAAQGGANEGLAGARGVRTGQGGGLLAGQIIAKDDKSVTIKLANSNTKIAFFSASTQVGEFVTGTVATLDLGKEVTVNGTTNADGSVTAQSIQVRPNMPVPAPGATSTAPAR